MIRHAILVFTPRGEICTLKAGQSATYRTNPDVPFRGLGIAGKVKGDAHGQLILESMRIGPAENLVGSTPLRSILNQGEDVRAANWMRLDIPTCGITTIAAIRIKNESEKDITFEYLRLVGVTDY